VQLNAPSPDGVAELMAALLADEKAPELGRGWSITPASVD